MKLEILGELGQEKKLENIAKAVNFAREKVENLPEKALLKCIKQLGFDRIYVDLSEDLLWMDFDRQNEIMTRTKREFVHVQSTGTEFMRRLIIIRRMNHHSTV